MNPAARAALCNGQSRETMRWAEGGNPSILSLSLFLFSQIIMNRYTVLPSYAAHTTILRHLDLLKASLTNAHNRRAFRDSHPIPTIPNPPTSRPLLDHNY